MTFLLLIMLLNPGFALKIFDFEPAKMFAAFTHGELEKQGYAVLSHNSMEDPMLLSEILKETGEFYPKFENFSYALGNVQGRTAIAPGIHKIGGAPKQVLVSGHSEASYLEITPRFLMFTCFQPAKEGGQTPIYNIKAMTNIMKNSNVGQVLLDEVFQKGITYIRNDVSEDSALAEAWKNIGYPTWQKRFPGKSQAEILDQLADAGMEAYFDEENTLHSEWDFPGFRAHPETGEQIWFNQLYAMNARYWRQHGHTTILSLPFDQRPLSSRVGRIGDNRQLNEAEYALLDNMHFETQEMFDWKKGRVLIVDNFEFQHGRLPYDGERRCAVGWGPSVSAKNCDVLHGFNAL